MSSKWIVFIEFFCFGVVVMLALHWKNQPSSTATAVTVFSTPRNTISQNEQPVTPQNVHDAIPLETPNL